MKKEKTTELCDQPNDIIRTGKERHDLATLP